MVVQDNGLNFIRHFENFVELHKRLVELLFVLYILGFDGINQSVTEIINLGILIPVIAEILAEFKVSSTRNLASEFFKINSHLFYVERHRKCSSFSIFIIHIKIKIKKSKKK